MRRQDGRRLHQVIAFAADFYRHLLRAANGAAQSDDAEIDRFIDEALKRQSLDLEKTVARLERCLEADQQIDRNANQSTLIESWLDGLGAI